MEKYWEIGDVLQFDEIGGTFTICKILGVGSSCVVYLTEYRDVHGNVLNCLLKEYNPRQLEIYRDSDGWFEETEDDELFLEGLRRFEEGYRRQIAIRRIETLTNTATNIQGIYKKYGTEYIAMPLFAGTTYEEVEEKSFHSLFKRMRAIARVIGEYHEKGYLHLDIKPGNIWSVPETEEFVMLFDFDSVMKKEEVGSNTVVSSTWEWAAPEQLIPGQRSKICEATDIFAIGEMIFSKIFRRHSELGERQQDAVYDLEQWKVQYPDVNPAVWRKLADLFRSCLCVDVEKRTSDVGAVEAALEELIDLSGPKKYSLQTHFPETLSFFVGRDDELSKMQNVLAKENLLMLTGMGGIGKSELAKQYYARNRELYDVVIFAHQTEGLYSLFLDDQVFCIANMVPFREDKETKEQYYQRKMKAFRDLCNENVLIILDNIDDYYTEKEDLAVLNMFLTLPCKKIITTRLSDWEYRSLEIQPLQKEEELLQIFEHWCPLDSAGERDCARAIIKRYEGYTMAVELIAKTITACFMTPSEFLAQVEKKDTMWNKQRVKLFKDNDVKREAGIILLGEVFSLGFLSEEHIRYLGILSLFGTITLEVKFLRQWISDFDSEILGELINHGWLIRESNAYVKMHPVIVDVIRNKECDTQEVTSDLIRSMNAFVLAKWDMYCSADDKGVFKMTDYNKLDVAMEALYNTLNRKKGNCGELPELFYNLRKFVVLENAEEKVESLCKNKLTELYGDHIPDDFYNRYREEIDSIKKNKTGSVLLLAHYVMDKCKESKGSVIVSGTWNNSFVVWLLGLSWYNPLSSEWRNSEYKLPYNEAEYTFSHGKIELSVAEETVDEIGKLMESLEEVSQVRIEKHGRAKILYLCPRGNSFKTYLREDENLKLQNLWFYPVDFTEIKVLPNENLSELKKMGITNEDIGRTDFSNPDIIKEMFAELPVEMRMQLHYSPYGVSHETIKEEHEKMYSLLEVCPKETMLDYINALGMLTGSYVWEHNQDALFKSGKRAWKDCFFYREDVYGYLLAKDVEEERALAIMKAVRKGLLRHARYVYLLDGLDIPEDVVEIWKNIRYMFPISHTISSSIVKYMRFLHKESDSEEWLNLDEF